MKPQAENVELSQRLDLIVISDNEIYALQHRFNVYLQVTKGKTDLHHMTVNMVYCVYALYVSCRIKDFNIYLRSHGHIWINSLQVMWFHLTSAQLCTVDTMNETW